MRLKQEEFNGESDINKEIGELLSNQHSAESRKNAAAGDDDSSAPWNGYDDPDDYY